MPEDNVREVRARATVSFQGIHAGVEYFVNIDFPDIRQALADGFLVEIPQDQSPVAEDARAVTDAGLP